MEDDSHVRITLRLPRDLHGQLEKAARDSFKSLNAQIVESAQFGVDAAARVALRDAEAAHLMNELAMHRARADQIKKEREVALEETRYLRHRLHELELPSELKDRLAARSKITGAAARDELVSLLEFALSSEATKGRMKQNIVRELEQARTQIERAATHLEAVGARIDRLAAMEDRSAVTPPPTRP